MVRTLLKMADPVKLKEAIETFQLKCAQAEQILENALALSNVNYNNALIERDAARIALETEATKP